MDDTFVDEADLDEDELSVVVDESVDELLRGDYESDIPEPPEVDDSS